MKVTLTQHPVGQGGMMSGMLQISGGKLHWVYDCGSNQRESRNREIARVARQGSVDMLFLSHLDSDHVDGIDRLLTSTSVKEVILPYLNDIDRLVAAARDISAGQLTGNFTNMLSDMEGWFRERGVETITFIRPRSDGDEGPRPDFPAKGGEGGPEGPIKPQWITSESEQAEQSLENGQSFIERTFQTSAFALTIAASGSLDWIFSPYAHRPTDEQLRAFRTKLISHFGASNQPQAVLKAILFSDSERKKLKECYDEIWSDHNLVSMALYAGPFTDAKPWTHARLRSRNRHCLYFGKSQEVGWLLTGDAHLDVEIRRLNFLNHYGSLLDRVQVFGLPHHGSKHNFHPKLLQPMPNLSHCVAAAGPNSHGHPGEAVKIAVDAAGIGFVRVGHRQHHEFTWEHD